MFKHRRLIACGLILFPLLMCIITCGFGSCDRKTELPQTSSEELSEPISEDITPSLLEEIDELKEALLEKENELDKIKIEKEDLENQVVSMEQEFQNEIQQIREEVYKLIEKDILGFNKPEAKIKLVPIKTKDDDVGNITVQIFDNDNITYLQQRTWFFYVVSFGNIGSWCV
jgi:NTP pyrophosphatase (non-canonical NTP hydrolase)